MIVINDSILLKKLLTNRKISCYFESDNLNFKLIKYEKEEILNSPLKPLKNFLFVVEGKIKVYGLRNDGSIYTVDMADSQAVLGDVEFCSNTVSPFFVEAIEDVLCIALSIEENRFVLEHDTKFLRFLLTRTVNKMVLLSKLDLVSQSLEEKVLLYLRDIQPDHTMHGINSAVVYLHCSRRQLQRVLKKMCDDKKIEKIKKGTYILAEY